MSTKHTPGPWFVGAMNDALFITNEPPRPAPVDSVNPTLTAKVIAKPSEPHQEGWTYGEYTANAQLIAASPDLLEACKSSQCSCSVAERDSGHKSDCWFPKMEAAIAKAEGITECL